ncbi:hypothetical protein MKEN_00501900 [Mycena kentingensis (nom. inval.)]|nr:hypothetical protein MKEN_00501900 [Mycena kentingensis (nom. inval.)]
MHPPVVYSSLTVPVAPATSFGGIQWTADGQVLFLTKLALYIMTPDHGLSFDPAAKIKAQLRPVKKSASDPQTDVELISWYRTLVQFDRPVDYRWPEQSQDWTSIVLGTVDIALWEATASPSGLSANAGCIIAALTASMDCSLWTAKRNGLNREWYRIFDITPFLLDHFAHEIISVRALKAQVTSIHWSPQSDFGLRPAPLDASLLVAGNRAGMLLFFRYRDLKVELVKTTTVAYEYVVRVAISPWRHTIESGKSDASVAFATEDGRVCILPIAQLLEMAPSASTFGFPYAPKLEILEHSMVEICRRDSRPARGLQWIELRPGQNILVYTKPGSIGLWQAPSPSASWSGTKKFTLPILPKLSTGTSSFHSSVGLVYLTRKDTLFVFLSDGTIRALREVSSQPTWDTTESESLTRTARSMLVRVEPPGTITKDVVARASGVASYDGGATVLSLQEAIRPADFDYIHDAQHRNQFVVSRLWEATRDEDTDDVIVHNLEETLRGCSAGSGLSPVHILRPTLFALPPRKLVGDIHSRLLDVLSLSTPLAQAQVDPARDVSAIRIAPWTGALSAEMRMEFRESLRRHFYGWDVLLALRLRLGVADFLWRNSETAEKQTNTGNVAGVIVGAITHRFVRVVVRHLVAAMDCLQVSDVPFVLRMVVHTLLTNSGVPQDLKEEGTDLSARLFAAVPNAHPDIARGLSETCPACKVDIPFNEIGSATCPNGHVWGRCSVTTFILSTPRVRTCVGCSRKAFLPPSASASADESSWLPSSAQGWVVHELLEAVQRCLLCGNSFVSVL